MQRVNIWSPMNLRSLSTELQDKEDSLFSALLLKHIEVLKLPLGPVGGPSGYGHGAFQGSENGHRYFDLRPDTRRNYLGLGHPLAIKSQLEASRWDDIYDSNAQSSDEYQQIVSIIAKNFFPNEKIRIDLHEESPYSLTAGETVIDLDSMDPNSLPDLRAKIIIEDFYTGRWPGFLRFHPPFKNADHPKSYIFRGPLPFSVRVSWENLSANPTVVLKRQDLIFGHKLLRFITEGNFLGANGRISKMSGNLHELSKNLGKLPGISCHSMGTVLHINSNGLINRLAAKGILAGVGKSSSEVVIALPTSTTEEHFNELAHLIDEAAKGKS